MFSFSCWFVLHRPNLASPVAQDRVLDGLRGKRTGYREGGFSSPCADSFDVPRAGKKVTVYGPGSGRVAVRCFARAFSTAWFCYLGRQIRYLSNVRFRKPIRPIGSPSLLIDPLPNLAL